MFVAVNIISLPGGGADMPGGGKAAAEPARNRPDGNCVTFLTFVKTVHFRGKQGEQFEKTAKSDMEILCSLT